MNKILHSHRISEEPLVIIMPDFSKTEVNEFLQFIYGQKKSIDENLSICQLFLKKINQTDEIEQKFIVKEEIVETKVQELELNPCEDLDNDNLFDSYFKDSYVDNDEDFKVSDIESNIDEEEPLAKIFKKTEPPSKISKLKKKIKLGKY